MDNYINVSYEPADDKKKEPVLLYTIGEVAKEVGTETSTIRHWSNKFYDYLDVQMCNTHRRYTKLDIDKLKIIKKCVEKKMTHNEVINTIKETNFDISIVEERFLDAQQPLDIQLFASAIVVELENKIKGMEENIINTVLSRIEDQNRLLNLTLDQQRQDIAVTVDEIVSEKLSNLVTDMKKVESEISNSVEEIMSDKLGCLTENIEEIKEQVKIAMVKQEEIERFSNNKGWFSRIFK